MKNLNDIQGLYPITNLELIAKHVVEGFITGLHKSPFHGFSVEFAEHRIYNPGESTRHIDWKLYGRTDKLFVKKYEEETNLRCQIVIDSSSSMYFPYKEKNGFNKLAFSVYSSAALVNLLRKQRDAFGLSIFSDEINFHSNAKLSLTHSKLLFSKLEEILDTENQTLNKTTSTAQNLHYIAENIHKRSLVIIFSDMLETENRDDVFAALQHLRFKKHDVIVFHVTDKKHEEEFEYTNRPYKFVDMETGEELKLNPNEIKDHYKNSVSEYFKELKLKCGQFNIDLVEADINKDFDNVLLSYLIKRSKLY